jgi:hypothetical protein
MMGRHALAQDPAFTPSLTAPVVDKVSGGVGAIKSNPIAWTYLGDIIWSSPVDLDS